MQPYGCMSIEPKHNRENRHDFPENCATSRRLKSPFSARIRYHRQMRIIENTDELKALVAELGHAPYLALDTEFLRDQTYYPKLCLIQVAAPGVEAIIDPLAAGIDL